MTQNRSLILAFIRRHPKLAVTVTGLWFVFVMLYLGMATNGAAFGLPMHLIGATFFVIVLTVKLMGGTAPSKPSEQTNTESSDSNTRSVPSVNDILSTGSPSISRPGALREDYSNRPPGGGPEMTETNDYGNRNQGTVDVEPGGTDDRSNGLEEMLDTEVVEEER